MPACAYLGEILAVISTDFLAGCYNPDVSIRRDRGWLVLSGNNFLIKSKIDKSFVGLHIKPVLEALVMQIMFPPVIQIGNRFYSTKNLVQVMDLLCLEPVVTPLSLLMLAELL